MAIPQKVTGGPDHCSTTGQVADAPVNAVAATASSIRTHGSRLYEVMTGGGTAQGITPFLGPCSYVALGRTGKAANELYDTCVYK